MIQQIEFIAAGVMAAQLGAVCVAVHRRLRDEVGVHFPRWADVANLVVSHLLAVAAAAGAGAALSLPNWQVGATWAACGGIIGPQVWPSVRQMTLDALRKRADRA